MTIQDEASDTLRTVVFIDYQNMYRSARDAFGWTTEPGHFGNFRPYGLARQMVRARPRVLSEVRVYTGIHTPVGNAAQHGQMQRRMVAWIAEEPDKVRVMPRPLKYGGGAPREKGVDVELAIDLVRLAIDDEFDVCVVASADTDLVPALQFVAHRFPSKGLVTVAYMPDQGLDSPAALDLPDVPVERHLISRRDFDRMLDRRNFYDSRSLPEGIDSARLERLQSRIHGR